jgi:16S rRNA (cytosine1402-N4)-methyltransferase
MGLPPLGYHHPVMLREVLAAAAGYRRVVDGTLGGGGHARAFLEQGAEVLGIDRDGAALATSRGRLGSERIDYIQSSYSSPEALAAIQRFRADFILLDLGVSSHQLDDESRGFTFRPGAVLDMRMESRGPTAADLLNSWDESRLRQLFADYGDERKALRLAREIVRRRERERFSTSDHLVNAVRAVLGPRSGPPDFARLFQAVRIAVNDEIEGLVRTLPQMREVLLPGGGLAVISYHSGEDRVVKHLFREWSRSCVCPPGQPVCTCRGRALGRIDSSKPIVPEPAEVAANPRARSAKLRVFRVADVS